MSWRTKPAHASRFGALLAAVCLLSVGAIWRASIHAQGALAQTAFGPRQYLRTTGPPNQYTDSFAIPAGVQAPFVLHIVNGDASGGHRVSSATITLNGVDLATPK